MKFENTKVFGLYEAIRGTRNSFDSWDKSDTSPILDAKTGYIKLGENDFKLAMDLISRGSSHRKFLRQIFVSVDITAPRFWWSEFDTYKVGTVANSCSTMHTLYKNELSLKNFETSDLKLPEIKSLNSILPILNSLREEYLKTKDFYYIFAMKSLLPESFLQKRTVTLNYEVLRKMIDDRKDHKLKEWSNDFLTWAKYLPYSVFIFPTTNK